MALLSGQPALDVEAPESGDEVYWGVTTILDVLAKPALVAWAATRTAQCAIAEADVWRSMADRHPEEAIRWLTGARFRSPAGQLSAADLGSAVHAACEQYALSGKRPSVHEECVPFVDSFAAWLEHHEPTFEMTECAVYNRTYGYAGTCDGIMRVGGTRLIYDIKTSREDLDSRGVPKGPYPEAALQLAAYRHAEIAAVWRARRMERYRRRYYLLSPQEVELAVPMPSVDAGVVLYITPHRCVMYPVRCDGEIWDYYLHAQELARWTHECAKTVIGEPWEPQR